MRTRLARALRRTANRLDPTRTDVVGAVAAPRAWYLSSASGASGGYKTWVNGQPYEGTWGGRA